jgi:DHA1 family multidrug resistance protein-like MFS transporter
MGNDLKLACLDPVILFVNMNTMLVYGVLYLWFEFFPFGKLCSARFISPPRYTDGVTQ